MTTTQQHEYKRIVRAFEHRHGAGSWDRSSQAARDEYTACWMDGYKEMQRWEPVAALSNKSRRIAILEPMILVISTRPDGSIASVSRESESTKTLKTFAIGAAVNNVSN
jgi:hypothetical protein